MTQADPRITLARADLAAASLEGLLASARYATPRPQAVAAPVAPLHRAPDAASERMDELLLGERFDALAPHGDFVWGQARRDGYVGFVRAADLAAASAAPTHRVSAVRTYAFAEPSIKSAALGPFSLNALVTVEAEDGKFGRAAGGAWFWTAHLAPVGVFEHDAAGVAERFLGAPYLWGGRTSVGLDCSGLVQQSLYACGGACPRDADQQARLGREIGSGELARGDLVCWRGHIGLMLDEARLIHANGHHMAVAIEPLADAIARIEAAGAGAPTAFRRL
jgi:cell wall-associated NlpC family hydrolase